MPDEMIKLGLDLGGTARSAQAAIDHMVDLQRETRESAGTYKVLESKAVQAAKAEEAALDELVRKSVEATQARQAMKRVLEESVPTIDKATKGLDKLKGTRGANGQGVLGATYALQDFITVLSMGGGFQRALMATQNNLTPMLMGFGVNAGLAGILPTVTTLLTAMIGPANDMWKALFNEGEGPQPVLDALDAAAEKLEKVRSELKKIIDATPASEKDTQKLVSEYLASGQGKQIVGGAAQALGASGRGAQLTEAEKLASSDEAVERAVRSAAMNASRSGRPFTRAEENEARFRAEQARQDARDRAQERINTANVQAAGELVGSAPSDRGARDTLRALAKQFPGAFPKGFAGELQSLEPESLKAQRAELDADADNARHAHEAGQRRLDRRRREKTEAKDRETQRKAENRTKAHEAREAQRARKAQQAAFMRGHARIDPRADRRWSGQVEAIALQRQLANPMSSVHVNDRAEARTQHRLAELQKRLGSDFPNIFNQTFENQARIAGVLQGLKSHGRAVGKQLRHLEQSPSPSGLPR